MLIDLVGELPGGAVGVEQFEAKVFGDRRRIVAVERIVDAVLAEIPADRAAVERAEVVRPIHLARQAAVGGHSSASSGRHSSISSFWESARLSAMLGSVVEKVMVGRAEHCAAVEAGAVGVAPADVRRLEILRLGAADVRTLSATRGDECGAELRLCPTGHGIRPSLSGAARTVLIRREVDLMAPASSEDRHLGAVSIGCAGHDVIPELANRHRRIGHKALSWAQPRS